MKYVFTQYAGESRFLARNHCISVQLGYEEYLSDSGYEYTCNVFVHDAYYKWRYITITDMPDTSTKLPYVIGDEIYFVLGRDLDKFKETALKEDGNNFKFVEKGEFYDWVLYNGSPRLKEIADNYFKNTKCSYVQFKNLNVGEVFKIPNREFLYIKVFPIDTGHFKWPAIILTGERKGYPINFSPELEVKLVRDLNDIPADCCKGVSLKELANKYLKDDKDSFMTYGGVDYNKIANSVFNYSSADVKNTLKFLELCQDYKRISGPCVKKVIFNDPATIVIWDDGSKTVVKAQKGEKYDKEKGLALCYMKKMLGNKSNFNNVFREWIKPEPTGVYDIKHHELGIQDLSPKDKKVLPSGRYRIKTAELSIINCYLIEHKLTYKLIAIGTGLSTKTVKRALCGQPMSPYTKFCLANYFAFPIGFTRYAED